jgi:hypothetical protein
MNVLQRYRGYYVDMVGKNAKKIQEYIANRLKDDMEADKITLIKNIDTFTGEPAQKAKSNPLKGS